MLFSLPLPAAASWIKESNWKTSAARKMERETSCIYTQLLLWFPKIPLSRVKITTATWPWKGGPVNYIFLLTGWVHFMKPRRNMIYLLGWSPATWEWAFVHRLSEFKHGFNVLSIELTQVFFIFIIIIYNQIINSRFSFSSFPKLVLRLCDS